MKKILIALSLAAVTVTGFAQGKIGLQNPATAPVTLSATDYLPADAALKGLAVGNSVPLASGKTLAIGLYAGTASGSLSYYVGNSGTALLNNAVGTAGLVSLQSIQFVNPLILGNAAAFGQIKVWDSSYASYEATPIDAYKGASVVFPFTVKTSYQSIAGSVPAGPIVVSATVPEPTVAAIAGLGLASMLIFRRKKA